MCGLLLSSYPCYNGAVRRTCFPSLAASASAGIKPPSSNICVSSSCRRITEPVASLFTKMDDRGVELWTLGILLMLKIPELPLIDSMDKCGDCIVPLVYLFLLYLIANTALIIWIMSKRQFLILNQFKGRLSRAG